MWAMTSFGILMPAIRPPHTVKYGDDRTMQIRARRAKDLDILRARYMHGDLGETLHTPDKDYEYRAYCTPHAFAIAMMQMVLEVDYLKFKPTTLDRYQDHELHTCFNAIWSVVMRELSTPKHHWDYWHPKNGTVVGGKGASAGKHSTGTGWSYPAGKQPHPIGGVASLHDDWSMDDYLGLTKGAGTRDTSAVRDTYLPDPALDELDRVADDEDLFLAEENALLDSLYAEIDAITHRGPIDHSKCSHPTSDNARARCRRRRRKAEAARIAEIRAAVDATLDEAAVQDDDTVLVGEIAERQ